MPGGAVKILQILPKIPYPPFDGHRKSMWGVIKYLAERGHEIEIVCYRQNDDIEKVEQEIVKYTKVHVIDVDTKNSMVSAALNLFSEVPYNISKYKRKELEKFLAQHLKKSSFDIIHVTNAHMGWVVDFIKSICSTPVVLREENFELTIMERYYENQTNPLLKFYSHIQYKKFIDYEPILCGKFDKCIMMSIDDEKRLLELNPQAKTEVIPLGVDSELLNIPISEKKQHTLVHIGALDWYPNLDGIKWFLNNVFPEVLKKYPDTLLHLYGKIPENFIVLEKVRNNVVMKGFVEDIWEEVKDASLAIVPLRIGSGIRVKILELLAAGINIITTSLGKEGIPVEDESELLIADSPLEFSNKIVNFLGGKYDGCKMAEKGKSLIDQNYKWEIIAEKFERTYLELIKQKS